jgi:hypothetical protein
MAMTPDDIALHETIEQTGASNLVHADLNVLDCSTPSRIQNKKVHDSTNRLIVALLKGRKLGTCIHITGDARAITDPFHRRICEEMTAIGEKPFRLLYHVPKEHLVDSTHLVRYNLGQWSTRSARRWDEELRTISAIGRRSVDLCVREQDDHDIQFSVFGHRYVLLQERHSRSASSKRVWLIESEPLNEHLTVRAETHLEGAIDLKESWYRDFERRITGLAARRALSALLEKVRSREELLDDPFAKKFDSDPKSTIEALEIMGFVKCQRKQARITESGRQFLQSVTST